MTMQLRVGARLYSGMKTLLALAASAALTVACDSSNPSNATPTIAASEQSRSATLPALEWSGADEAPADVSWQTRIAPPAEPGEPMVVAGVVYEADGRSPAAGVIVYAYHTNAKGIYPKRGDETGNGRRHGYLRGWMRTDERGRYEFTTIRPAAYPSGTEPAHVHMTVKPRNSEEYWLPTVVFEGDRLLTANDRESGSVIRLTRDHAGVWRGKHDVTLRK